MCLCFYSFDQEGHYLFTGASDSHIFVLDAKPSKRFSVIGYTGRYLIILCLNRESYKDRARSTVTALFCLFFPQLSLDPFCRFPVSLSGTVGR